MDYFNSILPPVWDWGWGLFTTWHGLSCVGFNEVVLARSRVPVHASMLVYACTAHCPPPPKKKKKRTCCHDQVGNARTLVLALDPPTQQGAEQQVNTNFKRAGKLAAGCASRKSPHLPMLVLCKWSGLLRQTAYTPLCVFSLLYLLPHATMLKSTVSNHHANWGFAPCIGSGSRNSCKPREAFIVYVRYIHDP